MQQIVTQKERTSLPIGMLSGHPDKEILYGTLTDGCTESVSSESGWFLEPAFAGPPFSGFRIRSDARWTPQWIAWAAVLMSWSAAQTLADRLEDAQDCLARMFAHRRRPGQTYQGWIAALGRWSERLLEGVGPALRTAMHDVAGAYWTREDFAAFAVDGSRVDCPRTRANEAALGRGGRKKTGPQFWLTTLWHMGLGLPWTWKIGPSTDAERTHLRAMLPELPAGALLVADAGFVGYDLLREIVQSGRSFLVRVGANVRLLEQLGFARIEDGHTVYLWPQKAQKDNTPPLVLRLIVRQRHGKPIYLVTNLNAEALPEERASVLYQMRWGIEIFYRSMKQTLSRRKMLSAAPRQASMELAWTMVGLQVLGLMTVEPILRRGKDPLSWSVALALRTIRLAAHGRKYRHAGGEGLRACLSVATKDPYVRRSPKSARNWPHKKTDSPAGEPIIRPGTATEIQHAARLMTKELAA